MPGTLCSSSKFRRAGREACPYRNGTFRAKKKMGRDLDFLRQKRRGFILILCMASWATKRKLTYLGGFLACVIILVAVPLFFIFYHKPTCFDGIKNGGEAGIDCGGKCPLLCQTDTLPPLSLWQRFFRVGLGIYNVVAYVENPNLYSGSENLSYVFRLYDEKNVMIAERKGSTFFPPKKVTPIFETGIMTGERVPIRVTFNITEALKWKSYKGKEEPLIKVKSQRLDIESKTPRLFVTLENTSRVSLSNVEVVAILFGFDGNALAASKTVLDTLGRESLGDLAFTWREAFESPVARIDIIPKLYPGIHY